MTTDLMMLTWSAVLFALLFAPYGIGQSIHWGLPLAAGNRASTPPLPEWANRAVRAHRNMAENFPHFAALVLVAAVAGKANDLTALGATIFFWARLGHAALYIVGVPWLRTIAFFTGLTGEAIILRQLF